ncbi:hypothetical protein FKG94_13670 [Exilibacterium tricleocarpae]|uniref:Uncharacterized protein n=1 Tax=Exilibacterium tricleocarpae TaxID=2591008 RepID=A0A545TLM6_9GAMM|nr:hypothetical protein [Exilibacterium tricleocarpae]TQV78122.1 hypothetical protein FKG94_13670 [Exilibacterium tricleocarpae]
MMTTTQAKMGRDDKKKDERENFFCGPGQDGDVVSCRQRLEAARLEQTAWGSLLIQAEERGQFTALEKRWSKQRWPFDEEFSNAVLNDQIEAATDRLIELENQLVHEGWRSTQRYRDEGDEDGE